LITEDEGAYLKTKGRKWIAVFVTTVMACVVFLQIARLGSAGKFRHEVDYKVYLASNNLSAVNEQAQTLLLSDSVTFGPISKYRLKREICDLTSNQAISLAGNFFLLKRYLRTHKSPRQLYLFFIYDLFFNDLTSRYTYLYFTTVFTKKEELEEIEKLGRKDIYEKLSYFNMTKADLKKILVDYSPPKRKPFILLSSVDNPERPRNEIIDKRADIFAGAKLTPFARHFLEKISQTCRKSGIIFTLVVEPMPETVYRAFSYSPLYRELHGLSREKNWFRLTDVNKMTLFGDSEFVDGIHLNRISQTRYLDLLDRSVLPLFPDISTRRLKDLKKIAEALELFYKKHGHYPVSEGFDGLHTAWGKSGKDWIKGLVPNYLESLPRDPRKNDNPKKQYLYRSNGKDYKLIAHGVEDCSIVKSLHPELIDPKRDCWAYGYWTKEAEGW